MMCLFCSSKRVYSFLSNFSPQRLCAEVNHADFEAGVGEALMWVDGLSPPIEALDAYVGVCSGYHVRFYLHLESDLKCSIGKYNVFADEGCEVSRKEKVECVHCPSKDLIVLY